MAKKPIFSTPPTSRVGKRSNTLNTGYTFNTSSTRLRPSCDGEPFPVSIDTSCEDPLFVELCNTIGIETALAQLGCILDDQGVQIGSVMVCKTVDESTQEETLKQIAFYEDGTVINPYEGPWSVCASDVCIPETPLGVITDLSLLL